MFRRAFWRVGVLGFEGKAKQGVTGITELAKDSSDNLVLIAGDSAADIAAATGAGFAVGCLCIETDTGALWVNVGTVLVASWQGIGPGTIGAKSVTAADMALAAGTIPIGQAGGAGAAETMSGDATIAANGALTLAVPKLKTISLSCPIASFTDNTDTTGYIDFVSTLPVGAIVLGWKAVVTGGFTGDTSAVIKIGTAGSLDDLTTDTNKSVFTNATSVGGVPKTAKAYIAATYTPRVTVTGTADFTSIVTAANGAMVVSLYYIQSV